MRETPGPRRKKRLIGCYVLLGSAFVIFTLLFVRAEAYFWLWLSLSAAMLGGLAVLLEPREMAAAFRKSGGQGGVRTLVLGVASACVLYGVFFLGNIAARRVLPFGSSEIDAVYGLGEHIPRRTVGLLLLLVVGPGEEIFWRGYVQRRLSEEYGRAGVLASVLAYGGVHVATGNVTLVLAAFVCGGFWMLLYRYYGSVWINMISHGSWAAAIFVLFPVS